MAQFIKNKLSQQNNLVQKANQELCETKIPPRDTALGSLINAIIDPHKIKHFQPTNINMSLFPPLEIIAKDKTLKK